MKPKILVTFIESGQGHIMSAQSIYESLQERYGDDYDVVKCYIMQEDNNKKLLGMEKFLTKQCQNTNKFHFFGQFIFPFIHLFGGQKLMRWVHRYICRGSFKASLEAFRKRKPDVIVSTHYYITLCAMEYKMRYAPECKVVTYNPDNMVNPLWDTRKGYFLCNSDLAMRQAIKYKLPAKRLCRVPFAVRKEVERCDMTQAECRAKYGLDDRFTVCIADGAYMYGKAKKYTRYLVKKCKIPLNILLIAGYNEKYYEKFKKLESRTPDHIRLQVFGFLPEAYELYGAADIFITKGGPNAVLDSVYMRTPVMINYCPHMIEEATYKLFVKSLGCGVGAFSPKKALRYIYEYNGEKSELDDFRKNIEKVLLEGNGADFVADFVAGKVEDIRKTVTVDEDERIQKTA